MKYTKPEITQLASALAAIQSSMVKQIPNVYDSLPQLATTSAYEADE